MIVNLCGTQIKGMVNVDISPKADKIRDLRWMRIPFKNDTVDRLLCMSAINYFSKKRAEYLIGEVYRVLKPGGVCRFGVQDLELICKKYLSGEFDCDRVNRWFGNLDGYAANGVKSKYVYDYKTLAGLFSKAGFRLVLRAGFKENRVEVGLANHDNRPEQMFYLEAIK